MSAPLPQNIELALFVKLIHYFTHYQFRGKVMQTFYKRIHDC